MLGIGEEIRISKEYIEKYIEGAVMWSAGKDSTALLAMAREIRPSVPVYFIDDHEHDATYKYIEYMKDLWCLNLKVIRQEFVLIGGDTLIPFAEMTPDRFYERASIDFPDVNKNLLYWTITKIFPLREQVKHKVIFTGMRWDEDIWRRFLNYEEQLVDNQAVQYGETKTRVHPMLHWSEFDILHYLDTNRIPKNPLYSMGYRSIGDRYTTTKSSDGSERGGRQQDLQTIIQMASCGYLQSKA